MGNPVEQRVAALVGKCYEAAIGPGAGWTGMAEAFAQCFQASSAVLKTHDARGLVQLTNSTANLDIPERQRDWADHWHQRDLWVQRSLHLGKHRIVTGDELLAPDELVRSGFYQEWLRPLEIHHMIGAVFDTADGSTGVLGIHRDRAGKAYGSAERRRAALLLPHLQRALRLHALLKQDRLRRAAQSQHDQGSADGILVVDRDARLLHACPTAQALLREADGLGLRNQTLVTAEAAQQAELRARVRLAIAALLGDAGSPCEAPHVMAVRRPGRRPLALWIAPLGPSVADRVDFDGLQQPCALIELCDPERPPMRRPSLPAMLQACYALTGREAELAAALWDGLPLKQAAQQMQISEAHARQRLKQIFAKTEVSGQAGLIALMARYAC